MNNLKQSELTDCDYNLPLSTNKTIFWDTFGSVATPKYRNIPVCKTIDAIKVTGITIENASGVKEVKNTTNFNTSNTSSETTKLMPKIPKYNHNVAAKEPSNSHRHKADFQSSSMDRQSSWSEPTLNSTKDRGDSAISQDVCDDEISILKSDSKRCLADKKSLLPKKNIVKGLLYIKNAGDVYKPEIEAKKLKVYEKDVFKNFPRLTGLPHRSTSKNLQVQVDERGDFDVAIYLSGLVYAPEKNQKRNMKDTPENESKVEDGRMKKRKMPRICKDNAPYNKSYDDSNKTSSPVKLKRAKKCGTSTNSHCKTRLSYQINKPNAALDLSGDDSEEEYELDESGKIVSKRKTQENLNNDSGDAQEVVKPSDSGRLSYKSRKSGMSVASSRTRIVSQYSLSRYTDGYVCPKPKLNEEETWETFEMIFKSYASTSRHSGEVIPRKISTEWMINAGIVNDILTQKAADDAFRSAAGAKITMNAQEYKEFLISLSLKLKLSYYEIYRRMCGM